VVLKYHFLQIRKWKLPPINHWPRTESTAYLSKDKVHARGSHGSTQKQSKQHWCQRKLALSQIHDIMVTDSIHVSLMLQSGNWNWWDWKFLSMDIYSFHFLWYLCEWGIGWFAICIAWVTIRSPKAVELSAYCFIEYCSFGFAFPAHISNLFRIDC